MTRSIPSLIVCAALVAVFAAPAAAISPGVAVPKTTTVTVSVAATDVSTAVEEGHVPNAFAASDCRAAHRDFVSRNTVQPSVRRRAIEACEAAVASTQPSN